MWDIPSKEHRKGALLGRIIVSGSFIGLILRHCNAKMPTLSSTCGFVSVATSVVASNPFNKNAMSKAFQSHPKHLNMFELQSRVIPSIWAYVKWFSSAWNITVPTAFKSSHRIYENSDLEVSKIPAILEWLFF